MQLKVDLLYKGATIGASYVSQIINASELRGGVAIFDPIGTAPADDSLKYAEIDEALVSDPSSPWMRSYKLKGAGPVFRVQLGKGVTVLFRDELPAVITARDQSVVDDMASFKAIAQGLLLGDD